MLPPAGLIPAARGPVRILPVTNNAGRMDGNTDARTVF